MSPESGRKLWAVIRRFLVPRLATSLYYWLKYGVKISPRAEVELTGNIEFRGPGVVSSFTKIKATDGPLVIGSRFGFASGCWVSTGKKGITIGDNFVCGPNVVISGSNYALDRLDVHLEDQGQTSRGVRIGNNVWIAAGSVVLDGSVIEDNTIVVANSLVNRRYPPGSILQGNPAKVVMRRKL